jgi:hypothetical protein
MAIITNYATLKTAIADYLARDDLTTYIPNFVQNTEDKLRRTLNLRNEETALSVSVTSGTGTVPTDFKALKIAYVPDNPHTLLRWVSVEEIYRDFPVRTGSHTPVVISREGANFIFGPMAKDFTLTGIYYAKQDPLETTDPSWYVTNAPEVLLYGSLMEAAPFIHDDPRLPVWQQLFTDALNTLREENDNAEVSKGQLRQRVS